MEPTALELFARALGLARSRRTMSLLVAGLAAGGLSGLEGPAATALVRVVARVICRKADVIGNCVKGVSGAGAPVIAATTATSWSRKPRARWRSGCCRL